MILHFIVCIPAIIAAIQTRMQYRSFGRTLFYYGLFTVLCGFVVGLHIALANVATEIQIQELINCDREHVANTGLGGYCTTSYENRTFIEKYLVIYFGGTFEVLQPLFIGVPVVMLLSAVGLCMHKVPARQRLRSPFFTMLVLLPLLTYGFLFLQIVL